LISRLDNAKAHQKKAEYLWIATKAKTDGADHRALAIPVRSDDEVEVGTRVDAGIIVNHKVSHADTYDLPRRKGLCAFSKKRDTNSVGNNKQNKTKRNYCVGFAIL
jgi:hypothetical protein